MKKNELYNREKPNRLKNLGENCKKNWEKEKGGKKKME